MASCKMTRTAAPKAHRKIGPIQFSSLVVRRDVGSAIGGQPSEGWRLVAAGVAPYPAIVMNEAIQRVPVFCVWVLLVPVNSKKTEAGMRHRLLPQPSGRGSPAR